jgi:hypothetical protein
MADHAIGPYRLADDGVGPDCEALAGGEERLRLAVGKCDAHHRTHSRPHWELFVP